jgi:hypothetical protein
MREYIGHAAAPFYHAKMPRSQQQGAAMIRAVSVRYISGEGAAIVFITRESFFAAQP